MTTPDKIYLLDMGDEVTWADEPDPDIGMKPDDAVEYIRLDKVIKVLIENHKTNGYTDEDGGWKMLYLNDAIKAVKSIRNHD